MLRLLPLFLLMACAQPQADTPQSSDANWSLLTDGSHTNGWAMAGPGEFVIDNGTLKTTGGMGLLWYKTKSFKNFTLSLEWKVEAKENNSGIFVRFPDPGKDPWVAVNHGYELQICDTGGAKHDTGSVYSFKESSHMPTKKVGAWNVYEVIVIGQNYTVTINGEVVNQFEGDRTLEGYIGLQNHDDGSPVRYRNIKVREL